MQINNFSDQMANDVKSKKVPQLKKESEGRCRKIITINDRHFREEGSRGRI